MLEDNVSQPLLEAERVCVEYRVSANDWLGRSLRIAAVQDVDLSLERGASVGLVGESGCGKSSLARALLGLVPLSAGRVRFAGKDIAVLGRREHRLLRRRAQLIFQDPYSSLNNRLTVEETLVEPLRYHRLVASKAEARMRAATLLEIVRLPQLALGRYPNELSGGQRQRVAIARALSVEPDLLVADEPVSSLDVSIRGQIVDLLIDLRERLGLTLLFISHDLAVVRELCATILVMYLGRVVEEAPTEHLFTASLHPYSEALIAAVPEPDPDTERTRYDELDDLGEPPSPIDPPSGCAFHPRCPHAFDPCGQLRPELEEMAPRRQVACWLHTSSTREAAGLAGRGKEHDV